MRFVAEGEGKLRIAGDPKDRVDVCRTDDLREGGVAAARLGRVGGRRTARRCCAAASATARCCRRPLLEGVPPETKRSCAKKPSARSPCCRASTTSTLRIAIEINDSDFGLQAGVFTRDLYKAQQAWNTLDVGGVVIGDVPSWRVDHMPYGGVKESGLGREGVKFAIEDMTEIRMMVVRTPGA